MIEVLNAFGYPFASTDYQQEFENILAKILVCYRLMVNDNVNFPNNENQIRDYMLKNYLKKQWFKEQYELTNYLFDPELPENTGRIDIRVIPVNPLINDDAFYVIECKRLNAKNQGGTTGLNAEYVKNGICRFVSERYSSYFRVNGMIGFVVETMDIKSNITYINNLLDTEMTDKRGINVLSNKIQELTFKRLIPNFPYSYLSVHKVNNDKEIIIYHLMLDFSNNIQ